MTIYLNDVEIRELDRQHPSTKSRGGWQALMIGLQVRTDRSSGKLVLGAKDLERIRRYAFDYGNGGWEARLQHIFGRSLGPNLDTRGDGLAFQLPDRAWAGSEATPGTDPRE